MNMINRIKCLLGRHNWRYYHRKILIFKSRVADSDRHYSSVHRRVCRHCKKRQTIASQSSLLPNTSSYRSVGEDIHSGTG